MPLIGVHEGVGEVVAIADNTDILRVKLGQRVSISESLPRLRTVPQEPRAEQVDPPVT